MAFDFSPMDAALLSVFGEAAVFQPSESGADSEDVTVIRVDPSRLGEGSQPNLLVVFGTIANSPFSRQPGKNDLFRVGGVDYRVFEVKVDLAGGIYASLTR